MRSILHACALVASLSSPFVAAQLTRNTTYVTPQQLDIELLFPQNQTYRPQYKFPVVFAIRNPAAYWPFDLQLMVDIQIWDHGEQRYRTALGGFHQFIHMQADSPVPGEIQNPQLIVNYTAGGSMNLTDLTNPILTPEPTHGYVSWQVGFPNNCSFDRTPTQEDDSSFGPQIVAYGGVESKISNATDVPMSTLEVGGCSKKIASYRIDGQLELGQTIHHDGGFVGNCPVVHEVPIADECGMKIDEELATRVVKIMKSELSTENCPVEWPNPTAVTWEQMRVCKSEANEIKGRVGISNLVLILMGIVFGGLLL